MRTLSDSAVYQFRTRVQSRPERRLSAEECFNHPWFKKNLVTAQIDEEEKEIDKEKERPVSFELMVFDLFLRYQTYIISGIGQSGEKGKTSNEKKNEDIQIEMLASMLGFGIKKKY